MKQFASRLIVMLLMVSMLIPSVVPQTASHPLTQKEVQMQVGGLTGVDCGTASVFAFGFCFLSGLPFCTFLTFVFYVVCEVVDSFSNG